MRANRTLRGKLVAASAALLLWRAAPLAAQTEDSLQLIDGKSVSCSVKKVTASTVEATDAAGKTLQLQAAEVASIVLYDAPAAIGQAESAWSDRDYERAASLYAAAAEEVKSGKARALSLERIYTGHAACQQARGDLDGALQTLQRLRDSCGDCPSRLESYRRSLAIARQRDDDALAGRLLAAMRAEPEPLRGFGELETARSQVEAGKMEAALANFVRLGQDASAPHAGDARLGQLRALRALGRAAELAAAGEKALEGVKDPSPALKQAARAAIAEALVAAARTDAGKARAALEAATGALAQGPPARGDSVEDYAAALLACGRAWALLAGGMDLKPAVKELYASRARACLREITRQLRKSAVVRPAEEELRRLGQAPGDA